MQRYRDVVLNSRGEPVPSVSVLVLTYPAGDLARLFSDDAGNVLGNPVTSDPNGAFSFKAANGHYSLVISGTGVTTQTVNDVALNDAGDAVADAVTTTKADLAAGSGSMLVTFTQAGGGAVPRSMRDKLREYVTITDYNGVIGDGASNCTTGMRAAIKNNLSLDVPGGTFVFGPTADSGDFLLYLGINGGYQTARDGLTIKGRGRGKSILKLADNAGRATLLFGASTGDVLKNITFRDLTIDLNGLNNLQTNYADPLRYNSALYAFCYHENITFDNVEIINTSGHQAIRAGGDTSATYGKNFTFKNGAIRNFGIGVPGNLSQDTSVLYVQADGILIENNVVECGAITFDPAIGHTAFELHGDSSTIVRGNKFKNVQVPWLAASSQKASKNIGIVGNHFDECLYMGSLDPSTYDQTSVDIWGNIYNSTKTAAAVIQLGMAGEVAKVRDGVRVFGNQIRLWGNVNQGTPLVDLSDRYIKSLDVFDNVLGGLNGSVVYCSGTVKNTGELKVSVRDNRLDSLGATGGSYPNSPAFVHIETSSGALASLTVSGNEFDNTSGKNYSAFGLVKLSGSINYLYIKGNKNRVNATYPLTTGTPTVLYKDIERNYPAAWQEASYESAFSPITSGGNLALADFTGWANNDWSAFRVTVFSTDGGSANNGIADYDVLVSGAGRIATRLTSAGTYATDITVQFTGNVLQVHNANAATLYVQIALHGTSAKAVTFTV